MLLIAGLAIIGALRRWWLPLRAAQRGAEAPALVEAREWASALGPRELSTRGATSLRWQPAGACVEVYRLTIATDDQPALTEAYLALTGEGPRMQATLIDAMAVDGPSHPAAVDASTTTASSTRRRTLHASPFAVGPAAPDLACRLRAWDRLEDLVALAWPKLPARAVRVGEAWTGAAVEGRCARALCPEPAAPGWSCRPWPWRERLAGRADDRADDLALVVSDWDDGHPEGVRSRREVLVAGGRPVAVRLRTEQPGQGRRQLELRAIDECRGRALAPGDAEPLAHVRARLR